MFWIFKLLRARGAHRRRHHDVSRSGLVLHGVLSAREDVSPQELAFSQGFVKLGNQDLDGVGRESGDEASESFVSARVVFGHDRLARGAKGGAEMIDHSGDQGTTHDATGYEGGKGDPKSRAEAQTAASDPLSGLPPGVHRGAHRGAQTAYRRR